MIDVTTPVAGIRVNGINLPIAKQDEYPNEDMKWARQACENDIQEEWAGKSIVMINNLSPITELLIPSNGAVKTSDGAYYTYAEHGSSVEHTWDDTNARVSVNYKPWKLRWVIGYYSSTTMQYGVSIEGDILYIGIKGMTRPPSRTATSIYDVYGVEGFEDIDNTINSLATRTFQIFASTLKYIKMGTPVNISTQNLLSGGSSLQKCEIMFISSNLNMAFSGAYSLREINIQYDNCTDFSYAFQNCVSLLNYTLNDIPDNSKLYYTFAYCTGLRNLVVSGGGISTLGFFVYNATSLTTIEALNLISVTSVNSAFQGCTNLTNLTLYNIKIALQIGSASSWGHKLTLESLLHTIKELWNLTGSTTQKLTVGTANMAKIENLYVKLIPITDEMRAADPYVDEKLPFEVCESTDEGAMLLTTEYATGLKNWTIG